MRIPNTFGFDVKAAVYAEYHSVEELEKWIAEGRITSPFLHIGCGSNLLFEKDYEGTVLHSRIGGVEVTADTCQNGHFIPKIIIDRSTPKGRFGILPDRLLAIYHIIKQDSLFQINLT